MSYYSIISLSRRTLLQHQLVGYVGLESCPGLFQNSASRESGIKIYAATTISKQYAEITSTKLEEFMDRAFIGT